MKLKPTLIALAASTLVFAGAPARAQSNAVLDEMRAEIRALRAELDALKKARAAEARPADSSGWGERIEQLEIRSKDAVVLGDIGGGFRLPGSETTLRLYGNVEAHLIHDLKATAPGDTFTNLPEQPLAGGGARSGQTSLTAQTSRFGIESSTPTSLGSFNTKLEMDFYAYCGAECNRNRLRLRHAYGEYGGFLVGQTWSTFMDLDNLPETVDFNGPIGAPFSRRTMIRYTYGDAKAGYRFALAAEDPDAGARMPNLVARFDKSFDWGALNVRGLAHEKRVGGDSRRGYGFGVGGSLKLTDKDLLMAQYAQVDGDIDNLYGSNGYFTDAAGQIDFDKNKGLVLGYARTFSDRLRGNAAFGMNRGKAADGFFDNRTLQQLFVNLIYSPMKNVELGGEVILGERKTFAGEIGRMQRVDLMGRYSF